MVKNKLSSVLVISLIGSLALAACAGAAAPGPAATEAPQVVAPEPTPAVDAVVPTEAPQQDPQTDALAAGVSFASDVMPILQSRCFNCHGGERVEEDLQVGSYEELMAGSKNGPVIVPGDAANSLLVELIATQKMPKRGPKLTPPQVQLITEWINSGALNN
jgi:ABC-type transport system substrate-binding protein